MRWSYGRKPPIASRRPPVIRSKADIEAEIEKLQERLKTAPPDAVDAITASIGVWTKRLAEYEGPEKKAEAPKPTPAPEARPARKATNPKEGPQEKGRPDGWLGPE